MSNKLHYAHFGWAFLLMMGTALAQDFPMPKPTAAHKVLTDEVGTWKGTVKLYFGGPQAPPTEYKSTEVIEVVSGGLYVRSRFTSDMGERKFEGHGLLGYDAKADAYVGTWVDNFKAKPVAMSGKYDAKKKAMTFHISVEEGGQVMKVREVNTRVDANTKKLEHYLKVGDAEIKLMEIVAKRVVTKKKKPAPKPLEAVPAPPSNLRVE